MRVTSGSRVACIDMEGVLIPELWPHIAATTGIDELAVTTREVPDYPALVTRRLQILRRHKLRLADVQSLVAEVEPLPGAADFLACLGCRFQLRLVSDAFEEMIKPLWHRLGEPMLHCHHFSCDPEGYIRDARYARTRGKHEVIEALSSVGAWTLAVGDAFNDLSMLRSASRGILFRPSAQTVEAAPDLPVATTYEGILAAI